jgi:hypothetical protein
MRYDKIKVCIVKKKEDEYELTVNLGASVLSRLTAEQFDHMVECLQKLRTQPLNEDGPTVYYFPVTASALTDREK